MSGASRRIGLCRLSSRHPGPRRALGRSAVVLSAAALGLLPLSVPTASAAGASAVAAERSATSTTAVTAVGSGSSSASARRAAAAATKATGVSVSIASLSHEVVTGSQDLVIKGTVTNGTSSAISDASLVVQVQRRTDVTTSALQSWLARSRDSAVSRALVSSVSGSIGAGKTVSFSLTVPASSLPLSRSDQWGPRGLEVALASGWTTLARDRTVLVWDPGVSVTPARITAFLPLTATPAEIDELSEADDGSADTIRERTAAIERLTSLLDLADDGVVLAVDPALLEALGVTGADDDSADSGDSADSSATATATATSAPSATATAASTSTASASATSSASPTPTATATATLSPAEEAAEAEKEEDAAILEARDSFRTALDAGDLVALPWEDADTTALAHLGQSSLIASAFSQTSTWESDSASKASAVAWTAGPLDQTALAALPSSVKTVIAAPGDLEPASTSLTYTPSGTTVIGGRTVLIPDAQLSAAFSGRLSSSSTGSVSELTARQLLRAETAILSRQAPAIGRDVVVSLDRSDAFTVSVKTLKARLTALRGSSWTSSESLSALKAQAAASGSTVARESLPATHLSSKEIDAAELSRSKSTASRLTSVASVLKDPTAELGTATEIVWESSSAAWRSSPTGRTKHLAEVGSRADAVAKDLRPASTTTINLISSSADLPVRVISRLDQPVTVKIHLVPASKRLQTVKDVSVTVPAHSERSVSVPVSAVGSGSVSVTVQLRAADGTVVGTESTVRMRVHADWEDRGTRVVGGALAVLLVLGIARTVRKGRRQSPRRATTPPQEKA